MGKFTLGGLNFSEIGLESGFKDPVSGIEATLGGEADGKFDRILTPISGVSGIVLISGGGGDLLGVDSDNSGFFKSNFNEGRFFSTFGSSHENDGRSMAPGITAGISDLGGRSSAGSTSVA